MRKLREIFLKAALSAAAVITGGILLFLIGIILKRGLPQLSWSFLTTATSYLTGTDVYKRQPLTYTIFAFGFFAWIAVPMARRRCVWPSPELP